MLGLLLDIEELEIDYMLLVTEALSGRWEPPWVTYQQCARHCTNRFTYLSLVLLAKTYYFSPTDEKTQAQRGSIYTAGKRQKQDLHNSKVCVPFLSNRLQKERIKLQQQFWCNRNKVSYRLVHISLREQFPEENILNNI